MKKTTKGILANIVVAVVFFSLFLMPLLASAQPGNPPDTPDDVIAILNKVSNFVYAILGIIIVIMLVWAGITFATAEGDPGKMEGARKRVIFAIVGIIVGIVAFGIFNLVENIMRTP